MHKIYPYWLLPRPLKCASKEIIETKIPSTALSSMVPDQEPPYCKSMDQNHVSITHSSSSYPCSKVQPYEPIKMK
jgi:hypothetical protein